MCSCCATEVCIRLTPVATSLNESRREDDYLNVGRACDNLFVGVPQMLCFRVDNVLPVHTVKRPTVWNQISE